MNHYITNPKGIMNLARFNKFYYAGLHVPKYIQDQSLCQLETSVTHVQKMSNSLLIACKETIFHPQGGGQPDDKAWLTFKKQQIKVPIIKSSKSSLLGGQTIMYQLQLNQYTQKIEQNQTVEMIIDAKYRNKMMKLHTSGHLIDLAMQQLVQKIQYGKCRHFPDNPFVEYNINKKQMALTIAQLKQRLQQKISQLIDSKIQIEKQILSVDEALQKKVIEDGSKWKGSNFIRVVRIGKSWCCCGGTHLKNTFLLKDQLKINKITNKQKTPQKLKISYQIY